MENTTFKLFQNSRGSVSLIIECRKDVSFAAICEQMGWTRPGRKGLCSGRTAMRPCFTKKIKKKGTPVSGRTLDLNYSVWRLAASVRIQFLFFSWLFSVSKTFFISVSVLT